MIAQSVDRSAKAGHNPFGGSWIVARDEVSDRLQIRERGARPTDPQSFAEYLPTPRAPPRPRLRPPRAAASMPASILPICHALSAIHSSIPLVASQLRERSVF